LEEVGQLSKWHSDEIGMLERLLLNESFGNAFGERVRVVLVVKGHTSEGGRCDVVEPEREKG
jgi:hypothetical protein